MGYYPVFLELEGRRVLLVGGGNVAREKIARLVESGASVTVVAPDLIPSVAEFVDSGRATLLQREFVAGDTRGFQFVMVATDNGAVNRQVADEARANGALVNAADDLPNCDFILPAVARRGRITLAASTGGSSPAMARYLRTVMPTWLTDELVALADIAAEVRVLAREREAACAARCTRTQTPPPLCCDTCINKPAASRWQEAFSPELLALLAAGERDAAHQRLFEALGLDQPLVPAEWWKKPGG